MWKDAPTLSTSAWRGKFGSLTRYLDGLSGTIAGLQSSTKVAGLRVRHGTGREYSRVRRGTNFSRCVSRRTVRPTRTPNESDGRFRAVIPDRCGYVTEDLEAGSAALALNTIGRTPGRLR